MATTVWNEQNNNIIIRRPKAAYEPFFVIHLQAEECLPYDMEEYVDRFWKLDDIFLSLDCRRNKNLPIGVMHVLDPRKRVPDMPHQVKHLMDTYISSTFGEHNAYMWFLQHMSSGPTVAPEHTLGISQAKYVDTNKPLELSTYGYLVFFCTEDITTDMIGDKLCVRIRMDTECTLNVGLQEMTPWDMAITRMHNMIKHHDERNVFGGKLVYKRKRHSHDSGCDCTEETCS